MTATESTSTELSQAQANGAMLSDTLERLNSLEAKVAELEGTVRALADAAQQIAETCETLKGHPMFGQFFGS